MKYEYLCFYISQHGRNSATYTRSHETLNKPLESFEDLLKLESEKQAQLGKKYHKTSLLSFQLVREYDDTLVSRAEEGKK